MTRADSSFDTYAYDFSGRLITEADASGRTLTYQYAVDDRGTKNDYSDAGTPDVLYALDPYSLASPRDRTARARRRSRTTRAGPGTSGLVVSRPENGPLGDGTRKHTYDELGRLKKLEIVDDATQTIATYSEQFTVGAGARASPTSRTIWDVDVYAFVGQLT